MCRRAFERGVGERFEKPRLAQAAKVIAGQLKLELKFAATRMKAPTFHSQRKVRGRPTACTPIFCLFSSQWQSRTARPLGNEPSAAIIVNCYAQGAFFIAASHKLANRFLTRLFVRRSGCIQLAMSGGSGSPPLIVWSAALRRFEPTAHITLRQSGFNSSAYRSDCGSL